jgi:hypothetical protein
MQRIARGSVKLSLGVGPNRIANDCNYYPDSSGGYYPPEKVARLCRLCRKGKISIDPKDMVETNIANISRRTTHSSGLQSLLISIISEETSKDRRGYDR